MSIMISHLANRWAQWGYLKRSLAIIYITPVAVWGVSTSESFLRTVLRLIHTIVPLGAESVSDRWKWTQVHGATTLGSGALTLVSLVPLIGTGYSYYSIGNAIDNHLVNERKLHQLQQRKNSRAADNLYQELMAWEPNVDEIIKDATSKLPEPSQGEIDAIAKNLKGTLINRIYSFTFVYHLIDGGCRALRIIAIRIRRLIAVLFSGAIYRAFVKVMHAIKEGVAQEVRYVCSLVDQPNRIKISQKTLPEIYFDLVEHILEKCSTPEEKERNRLALSRVNRLFRDYVTSNNFSSLRLDGAVPEGAPENYLHLMRAFPGACLSFSKGRNLIPGITLDSILRHFNTFLPCMDNLKSECTQKMVNAEAKRELLWELSRRLPNLSELSMDMKDIDPRWQMIIAVGFARGCPNLRTVRLYNCDQRVKPIMHKFTSWRCQVTLS